MSNWFYVREENLSKTDLKPQKYNYFNVRDSQSSGCTKNEWPRGQNETIFFPEKQTLSA